MSTTEENNFEIFARATVEVFGEEFVFTSYEQVLGVLVVEPMKVVLGPVAYVLPKFLSLATKIGLKFAAEKRSRALIGTSYVTRTRSGIFIAENVKPATLSQLSLPLPAYYEAPIEKLLMRQPTWQFGNESLQSMLQSIQPDDVYQPLKNSNLLGNGYTCSECGRWIALFGSFSTGMSLWKHKVNCSQNPNRFNEWCDECQIDLTSGTHPDGCARSPYEICRECYRPVYRDVSQQKPLWMREAANNAWMNNLLPNVPISKRPWLNQPNYIESYEQNFGLGLDQNAIWGFQSNGIINNNWQIDQSFGRLRRQTNPFTIEDWQEEQRVLDEKSKNYIPEKGMHMPSCHFNPHRNGDWCDECQRVLFNGEHKFTCSKNNPNSRPIRWR